MKFWSKATGYFIGVTFVALSACPETGEAQSQAKAEYLRRAYRNEKSGFADRPIAIISLSPKVTVSMQADFDLLVRVEPNERNRFILMELDADYGAVSRSLRQLDGLESVALQDRYRQQGLPQGSYKVTLTTYDGDPDLGGKSIHRVSQTFHIGTATDDLWDSNPTTIAGPAYSGGHP